LDPDAYHREGGFEICFGDEKQIFPDGSTDNPGAFAFVPLDNDYELVTDGIGEYFALVSNGVITKPSMPADSAQTWWSFRIVHKFFQKFANA